MLKIHQLFFIKFVSLFIGTLLIASLISYLTLKSIVITDSEKHLKQSIALLGMELEEHDSLDDFTAEVYRAIGTRFTIIDSDGNVIAESSYDKEGMENHADRFEIMQAGDNEFGTSIRHSDTLKTDFLYVAKKELYHGKSVYLRLSVSLANVLENFYSLTSKLLLAFLFFIIIALVISYKMSRKIQYDIEQITVYLDEIANKNYKAVIKTNYFNEFLLISLQLKNLVKKLSNRERKKSKYTAKLRLLNKQRNDILSAISHEFKNPIASIMGYAETLHDDPDIDIKIRTKFLGKILSNADKISIMLDRLALSVKLENDDVTINKSNFDLCELTQEIVLNLSKKYRERIIHVECESTPVHADKTTIEMAVINLVDNALKYSEDSVTVSIDGTRLAVTDRGMGIAEKELEKITTKFYRVEKNTWDNSMGLGLAIVSYILKRHGTTLIIQSSVGEGSTFGFDISPILQHKTPMSPKT